MSATKDKKGLTGQLVHYSVYHKDQQLAEKYENRYPVMLLPSSSKFLAELRLRYIMSPMKGVENVKTGISTS